MYTHSVSLDQSKCIGCTDCIKRCPTEAIRVRGSKAQIIEERCIDCGNCIRICRNGAKQAVTDDLKLLEKFKYRIALPAPALYAQFPKAKSISQILEALCKIGFTDFFEVALGGEVITKHINEYMKHAKHFPVISATCPVILRLIQRRFPSLIHQVLPFISPMELSARFIKHEYMKRAIPMDEVGVFFISPCPAKATEIRRPKGIEKSYVDGVFSMQTLYKLMLQNMKQASGLNYTSKTNYKGLRWPVEGGLDKSVIKNYIQVDGLENVITILEKVEDGSLDYVEYIEALACTGGCLGGVLTLENAFMSRNTLMKWIEEGKNQDLKDHDEVIKDLEKESYVYEKDITPRPVFSLNNNMTKALEMMEAIEALYEKLPKIDCGTCGAPTCRCFAEDVVRHHANPEDCIFILRQKIKEVADAMHQLTQIVVPTESERKDERVDR